MIVTEFTAATYNVLADAYVRPDRYPLSPPAALAPGPRRALLLARIAALDVDLLCLQEVEPAAHAAIADRLGAAWLALHAPRPRRPDGASLFLRRASVQLDHHETLHYTAPNSDDQIALIAHLRLGPHALVVACTHLQWCRDDTHPDNHTGRAQLIELLDRLDRLPPTSIKLIAGDLNATSQSPVLHAARDRGLALGAATQRPWDTCNANRRPRKLDYLLHSAGRLDASPDPLPPLARDTPMPSLREPSDHLPLRIRFRVA
ncbi:MAG: endonuclease/exonuclease/phosphatase family protein [Myxococcales bacterium]|nr:endonuclease/exonuclease/phosphatase family protein [Myxococcales bacterium]